LSNSQHSNNRNLIPVQRNSGAFSESLHRDNSLSMDSLIGGAEPKVSRTLTNSSGSGNITIQKREQIKSKFYRGQESDGESDGSSSHGAGGGGGHTHKKNQARRSSE
jgi:hypothetical protein